MRRHHFVASRQLGLGWCSPKEALSLFSACYFFKWLLQELCSCSNVFFLKATLDGGYTPSPPPPPPPRPATHPMEHCVPLKSELAYRVPLKSVSAHRMLITMFDFRIVSNVNSVVAIVLGIYILCTGDEMKADAVWFDSKLARMACSIIIGYMIAGAVFIPVEKKWCTWCDFRKDNNCCSPSMQRLFLCLR